MDDITSQSLLSGLPENCPTHTWKSFKQLETAASEVYNKLQENEDNGNQYLVVRGLTNYAIEHFLDDKTILGGIGFRLWYERSVGLMKIIE
ncbi:hypothetical protein SI65_04235 [Aspergillus cristatus]|uniref:Uncharacterized protein n=1 Tax=Aspergillus cristatus TaxID=573508 RepID=A0A1E3BJM6_ASPCR|nr:hypothetical protein SI65_04235 [Aspergillus cristatus]